MSNVQAFGQNFSNTFITADTSNVTPELRRSLEQPGQHAPSGSGQSSNWTSNFNYRGGIGEDRRSLWQWIMFYLEELSRTNPSGLSANPSQ
jgi:hypothetical protein